MDRHEMVGGGDEIGSGSEMGCGSEMAGCGTEEMLSSRKIESCGDCTHDVEGETILIETKRSYIPP